MAKTPAGQCPRCNQKLFKLGPDSTAYCENCKAYVSDTPDEGGDYSDRNPSARLEREERRKANEKLRRRR